MQFEPHLRRICLLNKLQSPPLLVLICIECKQGSVCVRLCVCKCAPVHVRVRVCACVRKSVYITNKFKCCAFYSLYRMHHHYYQLYYETIANINCSMMSTGLLYFLQLLCFVQGVIVVVLEVVMLIPYCYY